MVCQKNVSLADNDKKDTFIRLVGMGYRQRKRSLITSLSCLLRYPWIGYSGPRKRSSSASARSSHGSSRACSRRSWVSNAERQSMVLRSVNAQSCVDVIAPQAQQLVQMKVQPIKMSIPRCPTQRDSPNREDSTQRNRSFEPGDVQQAARSAMKTRKFIFGFFRPRIKANLLEPSRRCCFAEKCIVEATPPRWYIEYVSALERPEWQEEAEAEAGIAEIVEQKTQSKALGVIVGTMLSSNVLYYLVERKNEKMNCYGIVMRTYDEFEGLDRLLAYRFNWTPMLKYEPFDLRRKWNQNKFFEERVDAVQQFMNAISKQSSMSICTTVIGFMQRRYLAFRPRVVPPKMDERVNVSSPVQIQAAVTEHLVRDDIETKGEA